MSEPVDDEPKSVDIEMFMDAVKLGSEAVTKASGYLEAISVLSRGVKESVQMMDTGRTLDARNLLLQLYRDTAQKLVS
jgi:hypothetical protein